MAGLAVSDRPDPKRWRALVGLAATLLLLKRDDLRATATESAPIGELA